jgi:predicted DCC family thiol-disulfide oxidoreductase YuxK
MRSHGSAREAMNPRLHVTMHLVMRPVTEAVYETMAENRSFDRADYVRRLAELPGDCPQPKELGPR